MAQVKAVDPDIAVLHHPIELHEDAAVGFAARQREMFTIPADPGG